MSEAGARAGAGPSPTAAPAPADLRDAYLDLLARTLTAGSFRAPEPRVDNLRWQLFDPVRRVLAQAHVEVVHRVDEELRREGRDYSSDALTMMGDLRLRNLRDCVLDVLRREVPGDLIETGVWRGGGVIYMRAILRAYGVTDRTVWVADSFQGVPKPDPSRYPADVKGDFWKMKGLAISKEEVERNFASFGLLDEQVRFLPGWFHETLPTAPIERLAVLRLDGDLYSSTMDALLALYDKVSLGGYVIVDDYGAFQECRQAVEDFRRSRRIDDEIRRVDWTGAYWQRTR